MAKTPQEKAKPAQTAKAKAAPKKDAKTRTAAEAPKSSAKTATQKPVKKTAAPKAAKVSAKVTARKKAADAQAPAAKPAPARTRRAATDPVAASTSQGSGGTKQRAKATRQLQISAAERHRMIAEAAYLRAEAGGFLGNPDQDWAIAEAEVDDRLRKAGAVLTP